MTKQKKFADLSAADLLKKRDELSGVLVKFRVSADPSLLSDKSGVVGLRRDLRVVNRLIAQKK